MKKILLSLVAVINVLSAQTLVASGKSDPVSTVGGDILIETVILSAATADFKPVTRKHHAPLAVDPSRVFHGSKALKNLKMRWSTNFVASETTNAPSDQRDGFHYVAKVDSDLDVMLAALANDNQVQVLQKPRIQTSHATPASVFLASTVPYGGGTTFSGRTSGAYFPGKQISDREDDLRYGAPHACHPYFVRFGLGLEITPFVHASGHVEMLVRQTSDEIVGTTTITGVGDVPNTQSAESQTSVTVRDRETFIIGGWCFTREAGRASEALNLKQSQHHRSTRNSGRELFVLMRPTIVPNSNDHSTALSARETLRSD